MSNKKIGVIISISEANHQAIKAYQTAYKALHGVLLTKADIVSIILDRSQEDTKKLAKKMFSESV